jgi:dihydroorotase
MYTHFVKTGLMTMDKLLDLLVYNARKRFNIPDDYGFSVWDLDKEYIIDANDFLSKGKATPFIGSKVYRVNHLTVVDGKIAYKK